MIIVIIKKRRLQPSHLENGKTFAERIAAARAA